MPRIKNETRVERFSIPLSKSEKSLIDRAARICGETPAAYARETLKRLSRQVIQRAGLKVRLDEPEAAEMPQEPQEAPEVPTPDRVRIAAPAPAQPTGDPFRWPSPDDEDED